MAFVTFPSAARLLEDTSLLSTLRLASFGSLSQEPIPQKSCPKEIESRLPRYLDKASQNEVVEGLAVEYNETKKSSSHDDPGSSDVSQIDRSAHKIFARYGKESLPHPLQAVPSRQSHTHPKYVDLEESTQNEVVERLPLNRSSFISAYKQTNNFCSHGCSHDEPALSHVSQIDTSGQKRFARSGKHSLPNPLEETESRQSQTHAKCIPLEELSRSGVMEGFAVSSPVLGEYDQIVDEESPQSPYRRAYAGIDWKGKEIVVLVFINSQNQEKEEHLSFYHLTKRVEKAAKLALKGQLSVDESIAYACLARTLSKWAEQLDQLKKASRLKRTLVFFYKLLTLNWWGSELLTKRLVITYSDDHTAWIARSNAVSHTACGNSLFQDPPYERMSEAQFHLRLRPPVPQGLGMKDAQGKLSIDPCSFYSLSSAFEQDPDKTLYSTTVIKAQNDLTDNILTQQKGRGFVIKAQNDLTDNILTQQKGRAFIPEWTLIRWFNQLLVQATQTDTGARLNREINERNQKIRSSKLPKDGVPGSAKVVEPNREGTHLHKRLSQEAEK